MINHQQLRQYVIRPTLQAINLYSPAAEELLILTAAHESALGYWLHQINGPAMGIYQMEPATHDDCWVNYLDYRAALGGKISQWGDSPDDMIGNLYYATAMARVKYLRDSETIPEANDLRGLAAYWKRVYNTAQGKGTIDQAVHHYQQYVI